MKLSKRIAEADVINLGSTYAFYDFCYKEFPINGVNLAGLPQYLDYDLKYIRKYKKYFKQGLKVIIVLPDFVFAVNAQKMSVRNDNYYIKFYPWEIEEFSFIRWVKILLKAIYTKVRFKISRVYRYFFYKETEKLTKSSIRKIEEGRMRIHGWQTELGIPSMKDDNIPNNIKNNINKNIGYLNHIIEEVKAAKAIPYIVIPPVSEIMNGMVSQECIQAYLIEPIKKRDDKTVPVLNYLYANKYQDPDYYINADCLNTEGAKAFTQEVLLEIGLL